MHPRVDSSRPARILPLEKDLEEVGAENTEGKDGEEGFGEEYYI